MGKPPPIGGPIIIMIWSEPGEVKHLSTQRKRKQQRVAFCTYDYVVGIESNSRDSLNSGERNGK